MAAGDSIIIFGLMINERGFGRVGEMGHLRNARRVIMGTCYAREKDQFLLQDVFESSANFWKAPSYDDLCKQHRPVLQYSIRGIYRGERTVLTESEVRAAKMILRAFRRWKVREERIRARVQLLVVTAL